MMFSASLSLASDALLYGTVSTLCGLFAGILFVSELLVPLWGLVTYDCCSF